MSEEHAYTIEERLLTAIAHGTAVTFGIGIVAGIILYVNQREKSRFVAYQALQAAAYQLAAVLIMIGSWVCWTIFYLLSMIPLINLPEGSDPPLLFWAGIFSMAIPFIIMLVLGLYGLWAGAQTLRGKDFRYIVIGRALERSGLWHNG